MAVDMFLPVDGVKGESADANHAGFSDITNLTWDASQVASVSGGGSGTQRRVGRSRYAEKTHRPHPIASKIQPRPTPWDF